MSAPKHRLVNVKVEFLCWKCYRSVLGKAIASLLSSRACSKSNYNRATTSRRFRDRNSQRPYPAPSPKANLTSYPSTKPYTYNSPITSRGDSPAVRHLLFLFVSNWEIFFPVKSMNLFPHQKFLQANMFCNCKFSFCSIWLGSDMLFACQVSGSSPVSRISWV